MLLPLEALSSSHRVQLYRYYYIDHKGNHSMRVVVVLQVARGNHRFCMELIQALCGNSGNHEVIIAMNGLFTESVASVRETFGNLLPRENIRLWYGPVGPSLYNAPDSTWRQEVSAMIADGFVATLHPDMVLFSHFSEPGQNERVRFCKNVPIAFLLPDRLSDPLSEATGSSAGRFYFTTTGSARKAWLEWLAVDESHVVALSETGSDSLQKMATTIFNALQAWHDQLPLPAIPTRRLKLAYVSPLPPEHSGISDYSAELLPVLFHHYAIDVVVNQERITDAWIMKNCPVRSVAWFRAHACEFDRVLYHFGNSRFHLHMFDLIREIPGVVVLHDFFLSNYLADRDFSGLAPGSFATALYHAHGYAAIRKLADPSTSDTLVADYPCNHAVVEGAGGVIVHSEFARELMTIWHGKEKGAQCEVIPLLRVPAPVGGRAEARRLLGFGEDDVVVCSFGMPGPYKLSHRLLESWIASNMADDERCFLLFVGETQENEYLRALQESIKNSRCEKRCQMTGWITADEYRLYLAAADIGVQLRSVSRGETSAAALDCMNYGLATIVNANGSMAGLPAECVTIIPDDFSNDELKDALETIRYQKELRKKLGENARAFVQSNHSPARVAAHYAATIERFSCSMVNIRYDLLYAISRIETIPEKRSELLRISEAVADTFPIRRSKKQLFVDISELVIKDLKTGIQRVVRSVLSELIDHPPAGFNIEPVFIDKGESGYFYRYARQFTFGFLGAESRSRSAVADEPVEVNAGDIMLCLDLCYTIRHCRNFYDQFRSKGGLLYFVVYDLLPLDFPNYFFPGIQAEHLEWMEVASKGDGMLCISRSVADDVKRWFDSVKPVHNAPFHIGWFHLGSDIEKSLPTTGAPDRFELDLQQLGASPTFLMVGTVEPRKGHLLVLKACEQLWLTGMKINLVVVGKKGWLVDQVAKRMKRHKRFNRGFFWYESISDEGLQKLYAVADGVIMASEGEGFGLPLIEAARHGCPILARDLPVFREIAGNHATYFSGNSPLSLATVLRQWVEQLRKGEAPQSAGMTAQTWRECTMQIVALLTDHQNSNWAYRLEKCAAAEPAITVPPETLPVVESAKTLDTLAVDLTPVIPGGENGGAKVFLLELLLMLATLKPAVRFILLTRESSHEELQFLDRPNVQRVMVMKEQRDEAAPTALLTPLFLWSQRTGRRWKRSVMKRFKGNPVSDNMVLHHLGVDLLFCPFTSPGYAEEGIPTVCMIHDLQYKTYPEFFLPKEVAHRERVFMEACSRATFLTTISAYSRNSAIRHGNLDPARIRTIYHRMANRFASRNGFAEGLDQALLDRLNLVPRSYLLYPANFWKHKNHNLLLEAFSAACRQGLPTEMKLVCTGAPGDRQRSIAETAHSMGVEKRVVFAGYLPHNELAMLLSNATGMVFPSLYEGFGLPVIEAMAAGVPVACSNICSLPEVAAGAALLFDPNSAESIAKAMVALCEDGPLCARLVQAGLLRAAEFDDEERMAREYWELFESAMNFQEVAPINVWGEWRKKEPANGATRISNLVISVVTPSFNQGEFIERTLMSVAWQQGVTIEHVVFDGGSTDATVEILRNFNPALKWVSTKDNGQADAVNKGIRATRGDIIGWLNSDDIYYPGALASVAAFFDAHPEIDVVYGQADHIDVHDRPFEAYKTERWNYERLHQVCFICQPALFFRRRVAEEYGLLDESLQYCMDYEYWLRLGRSGVRFAYLEKKLAGSRIYNENKTIRDKLAVHLEINNMFKKSIGKVPKRWLRNYARISTRNRFEGKTSSGLEFTLRYFFAKLRWKH
jgi:glycosyltransferase involved in cell wall biosynthesis